MVWRYGSMQPTTWDDALDLVARVTLGRDQRAGRRRHCSSRCSITAARPAATRIRGALASSTSRAMKVKNVRIHNRPAYNSEGPRHPRYGRGRIE
ncbi:MAG: hypothetical protein MZV49_07245 [Rhodopseudomonas palustris]|nr:hypothetical protein [Rhodopseudomonas palustris]